jgi:hypothetical protein
MAEDLIGEQLFDDILATEEVVKKEEDEYVPLIITPLVLIWSACI